MTAVFPTMTQQEQALLLNHDSLFRKAVLLARAALDAMEVADLDYDVITSPLYARLEAGEAVPTQTNLAGAVPVAKENVAAVIAQFKGLVLAWNDPTSVLPLHAEIVGAVNLNGQT